MASNVQLVEFTQILIKSVFLYFLSLGVILFMKAEYEKIRRLRDYRDWQPYKFPFAISLVGTITLVILYLSTGFWNQDFYFQLLGGYLALVFAIPVFGAFTREITRLR